MKNLLKSILITFLLSTFLFAKTDKNIEIELIQVKTSQKYAEKLTNEKITLIMGKIIQKEDELKELRNKLEESKIDKVKIKKDFEGYNRTIKRQDVRINDIHSNLNYWGIGFSLIAILTGLVVILVNRSYAESAKKEAKLSAKIELKKWIDEKANLEFKNILEKSKDELIEKSNQLLDEMKDDTNKKIDSFVESLNKKNNKEKNDCNYTDIFKLVMKKYEEDNLEEALVYIDKAVDCSELEKEKIQALFTKGLLFGSLNRYEEEIAVYDEVVKRFEYSKDSSILEKVAMAYVNKALTFGEMDNPNKEIEIYDEMINRFKDFKNEAILEQVAKAYVNKAITLRQVDKLEKEIEVCDGMINRFKDSKNEAILEQVAKSYVNKAITLSQVDKPEKEIEVYDEMINRFKDSKNEAILEQVAKAYVNKAITLRKIDKPEKEIEVCDEMINRFKDSKNEIILEQITMALVNKMESSLILNNKIEDDDEKEYMNLTDNKKEKLIEIEMLKILEKAIIEEQDKEITIWTKKFKDKILENWSFNELKTWANSFGDKEVKDRLLRYIDIFENHNKNIKEA